MDSIHNVIVLGASGTLGAAIIGKLLSTGFRVTVLSRPSSEQYNGEHYGKVLIKKASYGDLEGLTGAFNGQDAIVEAFNPVAASNQRIIVRAAVAAGIRHIITPEFGPDTFNPHISEVLIYEPKLEAQRQLEEELEFHRSQSLSDATGKLPAWTGIAVGAWYDWGIETGRFWINKTTRTINRIGSGNQLVSMCRVETCANAVSLVLSEPDKYRNRPAYFTNMTISTNELISIVKDITGEEWSVSDVPMDGMSALGRKLWDEDTANGVTVRTTTQAYPILGTVSLFDEKDRYGANFGNKVEASLYDTMDTFKESLRKILM
ncbi:hypothetical protein ACJA88_014526 [Fusarium oxysporum]